VKFEVRKYFTREGAISTGEGWNDGIKEWWNSTKRKQNSGIEI
jgi:hypothetical protein